MAFSTKRDDNNVPAIFGVSSIDLTTPTAIKVNPATGAMFIDGASLATAVYTPATIVVAPVGYAHKADYYTDGVADNVEINAALAAVNAFGGGTVKLVGGSYTLSAAITIPSNNITLQGDGNATYIKLANSSNAHCISIDALSNIVIKDLFIDGNGVNQTIEVHGIRISSSSSYVDVINCKVINASHHNINSVLSSPLNSYIRVINCDISGAGSLVEVNPDGAEVAMRASYGQVRGCNIISGSFVGIELYANGDHCSAVQNFIIWNGESDSLGAIEVGTSHENAIVTDNIITGAGVSGQGAIKVSNANYCTVSNNAIYDLTNGYGVWVSGSSYGTYTGNTIKNLQVEGFYIEGTYNTFSANTIYSALMGINIRPTGSNNSLIGNICNNNLQYGIFTNASASNIIISGNQCVNNSQSAYATYDGIQSQAQNCTIVNNQCYDNQTIPTQRFGIRISGSVSDNFSLISNYTNGNVSGGVSLLGTGANYHQAFNNSDNNITINGKSARTITLTRPTLTDNIAGQTLTLRAGSASTQGTNLSGGTLFVDAGIPTGSGTSQIQWRTAAATSSTLTSLASIAINNRGSGYVVNDVLTISDGISGTGGTATVTTVAASGQLSGASINNGGSGYVIGDVLTIPSGTGGTITVTVVSATGKILASSLTTQGSGYTATTGVSVTGGTGTGATYNTTTFLTGALTAISLTAAGSNYALTTGATTSGGTGTGATLNIVPFANTDNSLTAKAYLLGNGNFGIGVSSPTSFLHLAAGTTTNAPFKFTSGTNLTSAAAGALEWDGVNLFITQTSGPTRKTLAYTGGQPYAWTEVTGTSQTAAVNNGYVLNNVALVTLTLPTTAAVGDIIYVTGKGAGGWKIAQNALGVIHFGNLDTTTGIGGNIASTTQYDSVMLVCIVANNQWVVQNSMGNITIV